MDARWTSIKNCSKFSSYFYLKIYSVGVLGFMAIGLEVLFINEFVGDFFFLRKLNIKSILW